MITINISVTMAQLIAFLIGIFIGLVIVEFITGKW